jgi:EmrB/QacA subfamily drug resistance transporter
LSYGSCSVTVEAVGTTGGIDWLRLLDEPARPDWVRRRRGAHWLVVASVCVGAFMGQLDASIVTLATPAIQSYFHVTIGAASWVALSYLLVLVAAVVPIGRWADFSGRKMVYVYGFVLFTLASLGCAFAPNIVALDLLRAAQALGAAMLQANSVAMIRLAMPDGAVARGIGVQGVAQALGLALGPTIGGLLVHAGGWRLVFLVNVPAGVIGVVAGVLFLPRSRELLPRAPLDWIGMLAFTPTIAALLLTLTTAAHAPITSAGVLAPLLLGIAGATFTAAYTWRRARAGRQTLLPVRLFASTAFSAGILSGLLSYLVLFGLLFVTPFQLERSMGWRPDSAGLLLALLPLAIGVTTPIAGRIADVHGARLPTTTGMVVAIGGFAAAASHPDSVGWLAAALVLVGIGSGLFTPANNAAIMLAAPADRASVAGGVLNMTRAFGTALGIAASSLVYALGGTTGSGGYRAACVMLAGCALLAAAVSLTRRPA